MLVGWERKKEKKQEELKANLTPISYFEHNLNFKVDT